MAMRMMRILRILRAFKIFLKFPALKRLGAALVASIGTVGWIGVIFFILVFIFAIFATMVVRPGLDQFENPEEMEEWFGTIHGSAVTLFIYLTMDDWSDSARQVSARYPFMAMAWIMYIVLGANMILSLLTGAMCDKMAETRQEMEEEEASDDVEEIEAQLEKFHS